VTTSEPVRAAGCVVWRKGAKETEVLLVHRPRWEDWSFPKGKLDPGEETYAAAIREVREETGLTVRLGPPLPDTSYTIATGQPKVVDYWCAKAPKGGDITQYETNAEIGALRWVRLSKASRELSYPYDSDLLAAFESAPYDTAPFVVIRHAQARSRKSWHDDDTQRPLNAEGKEQAHGLVPLLAAYGITRVVSSDALRCVETVLPYMNSADKTKLRLDPNLAEETFDRDGTTRRVRSELDRGKRVALCTHRPVLPCVLDALGVETLPLDTGALVVAHHRHGHVKAVEHYGSP
jgi:8-oxo-dGTP pyrophosphatase MutT (NUDIX family)/phosphohistidine phosphatase SixA